MEKKGGLSYTAFAMAKKLVVIALAAGYLVTANCRFICALKMAESSPVAAERNDSPCHPQDRQDDGPAPCCRAHLDDVSALLPANVALLDVSSLIAVLPMAVSKVALPLPRLGAFGEDRAPPLIVSQIVRQSFRGPRAPPSPTVVL